MGISDQNVRCQRMCGLQAVASASSSKTYLGKTQLANRMCTGWVDFLALAQKSRSNQEELVATWGSTCESQTCCANAVHATGCLFASVYVCTRLLNWSTLSAKILPLFATCQVGTWAQHRDYNIWQHVTKRASSGHLTQAWYFWTDRGRQWKSAVLCASCVRNSSRIVASQL